MFFTRRRWALRVVEGIGLSSSNELTTEIVAMIIQGSKQFYQMHREIGLSYSKQEEILMSASILRENKSAITRLTSGFNLSNEQVLLLFEKIHKAAHELAIENGFETLLESRFFTMQETLK